MIAVITSMVKCLGPNSVVKASTQIYVGMCKGYEAAANNKRLDMSMSKQLHSRWMAEIA